MLLIPLLTASVLFILALIYLRLLHILPGLARHPPQPRIRGKPTRLLIILGSGGHTAEMLSLLSSLDPKTYTHRTYIVSSGDSFSAHKAVAFERSLEQNSLSITASKDPDKPIWNRIEPGTTYDIYFVPRARKIHQSIFTTPISAFQCLWACFPILRSPHWSPILGSSPDSKLIHDPGTMAEEDVRRTPVPGSMDTYPDLILANGPATAVLVIIASLILKFFAFKGTDGKMRTIYVESWARVKRLSLSGRILATAGMVNRMIVQWEGLAGDGQPGGAEFKGVLVR